MITEDDAQVHNLYKSYYKENKVLNAMLHKRVRTAMDYVTEKLGFNAWTRCVSYCLQAYAFVVPNVIFNNNDTLQSLIKFISDVFRAHYLSVDRCHIMEDSLSDSVDRIINRGGEYLEMYDVDWNGSYYKHVAIGSHLFFCLEFDGDMHNEPIPDPCAPELGYVWDLQIKKRKEFIKYTPVNICKIKSTVDENKLTYTIHEQFEKEALKVKNIIKSRVETVMNVITKTLGFNGWSSCLHEHRQAYAFMVPLEIYENKTLMYYLEEFLVTEFCKCYISINRSYSMKRSLIDCEDNEVNFKDMDLTDFYGIDWHGYRLNNKEVDLGPHFYFQFSINGIKPEKPFKYSMQKYELDYIWEIKQTEDEKYIRQRPTNILRKFGPMTETQKEYAEREQYRKEFAAANPPRYTYIDPDEMEQLDNDIEAWRLESRLEMLRQ